MAAFTFQHSSLLLTSTAPALHWRLHWQLRSNAHSPRLKKPHTSQGSFQSNFLRPAHWPSLVSHMVLWSCFLLPGLTPRNNPFAKT